LAVSRIRFQVRVRRLVHQITELEPGEAGHHPVDDCRCGASSACNTSQAWIPSEVTITLVAVLRQHVLEEAPRKRFVFGDEDLHDADSF
jgi:hypothetical protein